MPGPIPAAMCLLFVSSVTDAGPGIFNPEPTERFVRRLTMLTLNRLDAIDADRLHRKLTRAWYLGGESLANRRYRLRCRVFLHLHKALLRNHRVAQLNMSAM
jgi:hypothetical protein